MVTKRLSKKRNVLLMFEFLTREASKLLIAGKSEASDKVISIIKEAFAQGTELHKEYRLANALLVSKVSSSSVASRILTEAKNASNKLDVAKLNEEKTKLIVQVEKYIDSSGSLYEAQLLDYKLRSTIGILLSDWRNGSDNIARLAEYENRISEHLISSVIDAVVQDESDKISVGERRALISIMSRKLEERWGKALNKDQKSLLRDYITDSNSAQLLNKLKRIKEDVVHCLDDCNELSKSDYFTKRLLESKDIIKNREIDVVDDESVGLGLLYLKLIAESASNDKEST